MNNWFRFTVASLLISIATLGVYHEVGDCEFIGFDDDLYVSENYYVQEGLTLKGLKWAFTASHASTWQPLVWLTYMTESQILGDELLPSIFHWTNLALHIINACLLLYLLNYMTSAFLPSIVVSTLFALHPVHTESVVWVAERKDVLSTLFWMLTLIFYTKYTRKPTSWGYSLFAGTFILGLMAKPMLITAPVMMLALDYWPLQRGDKGIWCLVREKLPLLVPAGASSVITFLVQRTGGSVATLEAVPLLTRLASVPVFYTQYLLKLVWPHPLAVLYLHPGMPTAGQLTLAVLLLTAITFAVWELRKAAPFLITGWLWFLIVLLPVIGVITIGLHGIADRFLYISAIGIYIVFAWSLTLLHRRFPDRLANAAIVMFLMLIVAAAGTKTRKQVDLWKTNISLFEHSVQVTDDNWAMYNCLGAAKDRNGDLSGALESFCQAASINNRRPRLYYNIGCTLHKMGNVEDAVLNYREALRLFPAHLKARYNMGVAFEQQKLYDEALIEYRKVIERYPGNLMTYNNIGTVYTKQGKTELALESYRSALAIDPDYIKARFNVGALLFQAGRYDDAAKEFVRILNKTPDHLASRQSLKLALTRLHEEQSKDSE